MRALLFSITLLLALTGTITHAANYNLVVQPVLSEADIRQNYQPLADYLSKTTGQQFHVLTHKNFLTYWERMKKNKGFDFVLDAAHFTDFRVARKHFKVLAKFPDTVSFTVITSEDNLIFEMQELISKKIATMASPGLGAIRLDSMFPNPVRLPFYIQVHNSTEAGNKVLDGSVDAAIIPTPLVGMFEGVNTVLSTDPVPHMALSVSADIPEALAVKVQKSLVDAINTPEGRKMLEALNIERFDTASNDDYAGYAKLLEGVFGY